MVGDREVGSTAEGGRPGGSGTADGEHTVVERALTERPSISIRLRIAGSMVICFMLTAGVTVAWMVFARRSASPRPSSRS